MDNNGKNEIQLRVDNARPEDANMGIVRMDTQSVRKIGANYGYPVEIEGKKKTVAIVAQALPVDVGTGIIRMDGLIRKNAGASLGEMVTVRAAQLSEAKRVVFAPDRKGIRVSASPDSLKRTFMNRIVKKGDVVPMFTGRRRMDDIFSAFFQDNGGNSSSFFPDEVNNIFGFNELKLMVISTNPSGVVQITENTDVELNPEAREIEEEEKLPDVTYEDIGGLTDEVQKIREMVELPMKYPELFEKLGISPPKGILLYGPPGTGKTLLAKAVANETNANFISIAGPEIMDKFYGESEGKIRKIFEDAEKNAPSIIFLDEIDAIATKREETHGDVERRVVSQLLTMMDGLKARGNVIVIAATNMPDSIDPALRRPGRFDREIEIGVPDREGRLQVLKIHTRGMPLEKSVNLNDLVEKTHGFVGADISALAKEAAMSALRRVLPEIDLNKEKIPVQTLNKLIIKQSDFDEALKMVSPSAMRDVLVEVPNIRWDDVGGLGDVKEKLIESVEWPLKYPKSFEKLGISPPKGILLYGPPGTGKTLLAKAVANETNANFISIKGPELFSKWVGESERGVRKIFKKARQVAPSIIFFDEIDSLAPMRGMHNDSGVEEKVVNQLLSEMDGLVNLQDVIVIGATNRPDIIDKGLLRPGRFDRMIFVSTPDKDGRLKILKVHTKKMPIDKTVNLATIAEKTEGYVGADLENVCREAGMIAMKESKDADKVTKKHFDEALKIVKPSITKEMLSWYGKIFEGFQKDRYGEKDDKTHDISYIK